jgi:hypothetical protein
MFSGAALATNIPQNPITIIENQDYVVARDWTIRKPTFVNNSTVYMVSHRNPVLTNLNHFEMNNSTFLSIAEPYTFVNFGSVRLRNSHITGYTSGFFYPAEGILNYLSREFLVENSTLDSEDGHDITFWGVPHIGCDPQQSPNFIDTDAEIDILLVHSGLCLRDTHVRTISLGLGTASYAYLLDSSFAEVREFKSGAGEVYVSFTAHIKTEYNFSDVSVHTWPDDNTPPRRFETNEVGSYADVFLTDVYSVKRGKVHHISLNPLRFTAVKTNLTKTWTWTFLGKQYSFTAVAYPYPQGEAIVELTPHKTVFIPMRQFPSR